MYRFILARPSDQEGRRHYVRLMHEKECLREVVAEIAASDEFQSRLKNTLGSVAQDSDAVVDVRNRTHNLSVEDPIATAEDYHPTPRRSPSAISRNLLTIRRRHPGSSVRSGSCSRACASRPD